MWGIRDDKIMLIHPPLSDEAVTQYNEEESVGHSNFYSLATVCRVVRSKGIDIVLHALRILKGTRHLVPVCGCRRRCGHGIFSETCGRPRIG
jgi:hypothetical protein